MSNEDLLNEAAEALSEWIKNYPEKLKAKTKALDVYGSYFAPEHLDQVTADGFRDFLIFKNNQHWGHIQRHPEVYSDMARLRECLKILLNEDDAIESRLDSIIPKQGPPFIKGLNRAVLTPILLCVYPDKYAVYNRRSDHALARLGMNWAKAQDTFGQRYKAVNEACHKISSRINQPLELVDLMFGLMDRIPIKDATSKAEPAETDGGSNNPEIPTSPTTDLPFLFPREKFLEKFLVANWDKTSLGKILSLYTENPEDEEESATQDQTGIGKIDILARDRNNGDWVVVELKKGRPSDAVLGQLLRYMGWIKQHKAGGQKVRGVIVASAQDKKTKYALNAVQDISFYTYRVDFDMTEQAPFTSA